MTQSAITRRDVAARLHDLDPSWMDVWSSDNAHMHRTLELAASLLGDQQPRYAEVQAGVAAPKFVLVVIADDRVVRVDGAVDGGWPRATVVPRHELRALTLLETPHQPLDFGELSSDSVAVALDFGAFTVELPSKRNGRRGRVLAELLPSLLADRVSAR
ncbi:hypothetical protein OVA14_10580 [Agrococcus sp. SL85]|uniref:hypothetical protein n=1 Tax=Agrococcus sp. SL85 TaxID=2995141 RepID=UPI00226CBB78|nr:hypothetical protein [Agrococcus sp. SL85]WAC65763.1 hypothetical protein OVA14_10580 [Agrococcus sp. SL85]